jgi:hypothetical protein
LSRCCQIGSRRTSSFAADGARRLVAILPMTLQWEIAGVDVSAGVNNGPSLSSSTF